MRSSWITMSSEPAGEHFRGRLLLNGQAVFDDIDGTLNVERRSAFLSVVTGHFRFPEEDDRIGERIVQLIDHEHFELVLHDRRRIAIVVNHVGVDGADFRVPRA